MKVVLECRPSWSGASTVQVQREVAEDQWSLAVEHGSSPYATGSDWTPDALGGGRRWQRTLRVEEARTLEALLRSAAVGLEVEVAMGLDGTTWSLEIEHGWNRQRLEWWHELPEAWRPLTPLVVFLTGIGEIPLDA